MQIDIGSTFYYKFTLNNSVGAVIDATGTFTLIDSSGVELASETYINNGDGTYSVTVSADITETLTAYAGYTIQSNFLRPLGDELESRCKITANYNC